MQPHLSRKIQRLLDRSKELTEDEVRSLMILLRKRLELEPDGSRTQFSTLNLFCNWAAHTEITQSNAGLQVLARVNDALVSTKDCTDGNERQSVISQAVGFEALRSELISLLKKSRLNHRLSEEITWTVLKSHIVEIIRDVPLAFPVVTKLKPASRKLYNKIVQNPVKPGAGVISIKLSAVNYDNLGATGLGEFMCLLMLLEDSTTIVLRLERFSQQADG